MSESATFASLAAFQLQIKPRRKREEDNMKKLFVTLTIITASLLARADKPATHGMLLFGDKQTYVSHLPMFHAPHDYQLILQVKLKLTPLSTALMKYEQAKRQGETLFTIEPEKMDLTQVIDGTLKEFKAKLYAGHFERGGRALDTVIVVVEKKIYSQKLNPEKLGAVFNYLVFGEKDDYYAAHIINGVGSFDSILKVSQLEQAGPICTRRDCTYDGHDLADEQLPYQLLSKIDEPYGDEGVLKDWSYKTFIEKNIYTETDELAH